VPEYNTLTDLLLGMSEPRLRRMRDGTRDEIQRLGQHLRIIEDALAQKQGAKARDERVGGATANGRTTITRTDLYNYLVEYGQAAKPSVLANYLATEKGVVRSQQAVRNGLVRLRKDGKVELTDDGSYAVKDPGATPLSREDDPA
jgi:hypothetical protein